MPQIKVRGINENDICKISEKMVDELVEAVKCPRDYFEIECIKSVAIRDGKIADVLRLLGLIEVKKFKT